MLEDIENLRKDYRAHTLDESDIRKDPFLQFNAWFGEALASQVPEPNAMILATSTPDGMPSARTVLLKGVDEQGFVFYTNYHSRKGENLARNPRAALVFLWHELQRQVRIEGRVEKVSREESEAYFQSRPKGSQIGAWASPQSQVISGREELEQQAAALEKEYAEAEHLPLPPDWGGFRVRPGLMEFWQGRTNRLHDRIQYTLQEDKRWKIERLAP
ncbi:MAG: pyridoxamine 5'-phosphate oxidase [Phaeodactylibacter sp.]|nr:pyridoxamine 5'-phosphate oxidase [Phaeodactylibacter sp.]MCB9264566.1 pyridoxamine 5'-phosphate oxidase [Lewinellaceae bacterium]MCB9287331.1 pyridoxamine 5'-phosphate oxidase [Lewinellaceae bacterium]